MKAILSITVILAATSFAYPEERRTEEWIDYRLLLNDYDIEAVADLSTTASPVTCTAPGLTCGDCQTLYLCRKVGNGFVAEPLDTCVKPETCNINRCSADSTSECALEGLDFKCESLEGMYPDPGSCKKFHYCVPPKQNGKYQVFHSECEVAFAYNPRTTYCDIPLRNQTCGASIVPLCKNPGDTGAIKPNNSLYYICRKHTGNLLYPFLYMCPNGKKYNEKLYDCQ